MKESTWEGSRMGGDDLQGSQAQFCVLGYIYSSVIKPRSGFQQGWEAPNLSLVEKAREQRRYRIQDTGAALGICGDAVCCSLLRGAVCWPSAEGFSLWVALTAPWRRGGWISPH